MASGASGDVTQRLPSAAGASSGNADMPPPPPPPSPPLLRSQEKGLEMWKKQQEKFTPPEDRKVDVTDKEDEGGKAAGTSFSPQGSSTSCACSTNCSSHTSSENEHHFL